MPRRFSEGVADLRELLDEVAEIDWRHPAWWLAVGATALLESREGPADRGDPDRDYFHTDGAPRSDTFMGRPRPARKEAPAVRAARAVARARAALEAIATLDGTLPHQPLGCRLERRRGWTARAPLVGGPPRVAFATPSGTYLAVLGDTRAGDVALAGDLGRILAGRAPSGGELLRRIDPRSPEATAAAIAVGIGEEALAAGRHLHRRAWTRGGGPWLGVTDAGEMELVTTSHLTVDGFGHALLASEIFAREDQAELEPLAQAARFGLGSSSPELGPAEPPAGAQPLGIATCLLDPEEAQFAPMAYALGRSLERTYRSHWSPAARRRARFSPTFQVPVAPGDRGDPARRRRRVFPGLMSIRMQGGRFESYDSFRRRLPRLLEREQRAGGVFTRMLLAARRAPVPTAVKRRLVASSVEPKSWLPMVEVLAGRGCLSLLRFAAGERPRDPLYAVSSPALSASAGEALGGSVLTAVHGQREVAVAISGTGLAGTEVGARTLLELWREELERIPRAPPAGAVKSTSPRMRHSER